MRIGDWRKRVAQGLVAASITLASTQADVVRAESLSIGEPLKNLFAGLTDEEEPPTPSPTVADAPAETSPEPEVAPTPLAILQDANLSTLPSDAEPAPLADLELAESAPLAAASGKVEIVKERYPNRRIKVEREVTQDTEGNYVNHGSWKMWDQQGNVVAEGSYEMGNRTGLWTRWHRANESDLFRTLPFTQAAGPFISQATFKNGKLDGEWTIYDAKQRRLSSIVYRDGNRHGTAQLFLPSGTILRKMEYENGELHGDVYELEKEGKLQRVAHYQHGRRLAQKITYFKGTQNKKTEATYLFAKLVPKRLDDFWTAQFAKYEPVGDDERHGDWKTWYSNGQLQLQGQYEYDAPVKHFVWWHPNGQKYAEGSYADGRQDGTWRWWHANGQKWTEGEFNHGEQTGQWSSWEEQGKLDQQVRYSGSKPAAIATQPEKKERASQTPNFLRSRR